MHPRSISPVDTTNDSQETLPFLSPYAPSIVGLPSQTMTPPPSLGIKREVPEVPAPSSVKKPRGAPPVPPASLLKSEPGVATKAGPVVVPKSSQVPPPGPTRSPPLIITPPKACKSAVPFTPTPPKQSMVDKVKKEEDQSGQGKMEEQVKQVEHVEPKVIPAGKAPTPRPSCKIERKVVKPTAKPSARPAQNSPTAERPIHPHVEPSPVAAKESPPQQEVQEGLSEVQEYMDYLKTRAEALSKRDDAEFDRMVQRAKKHPLYAEWVKVTSEGSGCEPEEYEFAEHEPLEEFAEWEWWLKTKGSSMDCMADVSSESLEPVPQPKAPLPEKQVPATAAAPITQEVPATSTAEVSPTPPPTEEQPPHVVPTVASQKEHVFDEAVENPSKPAVFLNQMLKKPKPAVETPKPVVGTGTPTQDVESRKPAVETPTPVVERPKPVVKKPNAANSSNPTAPMDIQVMPGEFWLHATNIKLYMCFLMESCL